MKLLSRHARLMPLTGPESGRELGKRLLEAQRYFVDFRPRLPIVAIALVACVYIMLLPGGDIHATEPVYSFGVVPQFDARRTHRVWRPILDHVERQTDIRLRLTGSRSIPAFESQFQHGLFDFSYMNPYHQIKAHNDQGYIPLVRDVGTGLYGVLVVRKDSSIRRVAELGGKVVAFPSPNALGASLLLRAALDQQFGITIEPKYVQSHSSVYLNVVLGQAAAGGGVHKTLAHQPSAIQDQLRILYKTPEFAPHPVSAHPRVPAEVRERVRAAFLKLGSTITGQESLAPVPIQQIGPATHNDYLPLSQLGLERYHQEE